MTHHLGHFGLYRTGYDFSLQIALSDIVKCLLLDITERTMSAAGNQAS